MKKTLLYSAIVALVISLSLTVIIVGASAAYYPKVLLLSGPFVCPDGEAKMYGKKSRLVYCKVGEKEERIDILAPPKILIALGTGILFIVFLPVSYRFIVPNLKRTN